jgi:hypothetical protein
LGTRESGGGVIAVGVPIDANEGCTERMGTHFGAGWVDFGGSAGVEVNPCW